MTTATDREELILTVPAELTRRCVGLALDMGGSVLKCVYRTKEDLEHVASENVKLGHLRLTTFNRNEIKDGLEYIRERAHFLHPAGQSSDGTPTLIHTTGVGCTEYGKLICETLNVRLENLVEFDCFVKSFHYLVTHTSRPLLLEPFNVDACSEPLDYAISSIEITLANAAALQNLSQAFDLNQMEAMRTKLDRSTGRPIGDVDLATTSASDADAAVSECEKDLFPCLIAMCGSGFAFIKVEADGSYKMLDGSNRGGRTFIGVGTLLTGAKNFDELIDMASKGNASKVHSLSNDVFLTQDSAEGDESLYALSSKLKPALIYCFGKAAVSSQDRKFSREDIAAAWLHYLLLDLVQSVHYACLLARVKRMFFCGGFTGHPLVRSVMTTEFARRNLMSAMFFQSAADQSDQTVAFDFIKPGQYLGAIGCLVNDLNTDNTNL